VGILEVKEKVDEEGGVTMTGMLVGGTDTRGRQRSVRWVLQALLLVGSLGQPALWFLLFARARKTSVLRGMFGIINVLIFFPSGALYPVAPWSEAAGS